MFTVSAICCHYKIHPRFWISIIKNIKLINIVFILIGWPSTKIVSPFFSGLKNFLTVRKFKITYVIHILFLLDSAALENEPDWPAVGFGMPRKSRKGDKMESKQCKDKDLEGKKKTFLQGIMLSHRKKCGELPMRKESFPSSLELHSIMPLAKSDRLPPPTELSLHFIFLLSVEPWAKWSADGWLLRI